MPIKKKNSSQVMNSTLTAAGKTENEQETMSHMFSNSQEVVVRKKPKFDTIFNGTPKDPMRTPLPTAIPTAIPICWGVIGIELSEDMIDAETHQW